jgi:hypothetical protein
MSTCMLTSIQRTVLPTYLTLLFSNSKRCFISKHFLISKHFFSFQSIFSFHNIFLFQNTHRWNSSSSARSAPKGGRQCPKRRRGDSIRFVGTGTQWPVFLKRWKSSTQNEAMHNMYRVYFMNQFRPKFADKTCKGSSTFMFACIAFIAF